jgi:hypothetical protein
MHWYTHKLTCTQINTHNEHALRNKRGKQAHTHVLTTLHVTNPARPYVRKTLKNISLMAFGIKSGIVAAFRLQSCVANASSFPHMCLQSSLITSCASIPHKTCKVGKWVKFQRRIAFSMKLAKRPCNRQGQEIVLNLYKWNGAPYKFALILPHTLHEPFWPSCLNNLQGFLALARISTTLQIPKTQVCV